MDAHTVCVTHIRIFRRLTDYPVQSISCPVCWKLSLLGCIYLTAIWYCQTGSYMNSQHPSQSMRVHMKITILSFTRPRDFPNLYDLLSPIVKNALVIVLLKWRIQFVCKYCKSLEVIQKLRPKFHSKLELVKWTWGLKQSDLWMNHLKCFCELDH